VPAGALRVGPGLAHGGACGSLHVREKKRNRSGREILPHYHMMRHTNGFRAALGPALPSAPAPQCLNGSFALEGEHGRRSSSTSPSALRLTDGKNCGTVESFSRESLVSLLESIESAILELRSLDQPRLAPVIGGLDRRRAEIVAALVSKGRLEQ
jgi:hypothetical protein